MVLTWNDHLPGAHLLRILRHKFITPVEAPQRWISCKDAIWRNGLIIDELSSSPSESVRSLIRLVQSRNRGDFPKELWLAANYDCLAEWEAYNYIAPLRGKRVRLLFCGRSIVYSGLCISGSLTRYETKERR